MRSGFYSDCHPAGGDHSARQAHNGPTGEQVQALRDERGCSRQEWHQCGWRTARGGDDGSAVAATATPLANPCRPAPERLRPARAGAVAAESPEVSFRTCDPEASPLGHLTCTGAIRSKPHDASPRVAKPRSGAPDLAVPRCKPPGSGQGSVKPRSVVQPSSCFSISRGLPATKTCSVAEAASPPSHWS